MSNILAELTLKLKNKINILNESTYYLLEKNKQLEQENHILKNECKNALEKVDRCLKHLENLEKNGHN